MPEDDRLEAISEALVKLLRRQDEIESRFARLEAATGTHATPPPLPRPVPVAAPPPVSSPAPPPIPRPAPPPSHALETLVGLNWINIAGVVTLIFAAMFCFKYAVDNNWVGPGARVALGIVAAMIALFFGDLTWRRGQKIFGQGITGLGLALLYVSFWASYGLYQLFPQPAAFLLMTLTTVVAVVFALRYESQAIAIVGIVAGYWVPGALSSGDPHPWILFNYVFLLNLGGLALARFRRWPALEYIAAAATLLWYGAWLLEISKPADHLVATVFAIAFYAQLSFARARLLWSVVQFLGPFAILNIWTTPEKFLPFLFVYAVGGLITAEVRRWPEAPAWTLSCYWIVYALSTKVKPELQFAYITGTFVLFFLWVLWWGVIRKREIRYTDLLVLAGNAAAYFGASYSLLNPDYHAYMGLLAAALAALNLLVARLLWKATDTRPALLAVAVTLAFLTLAAPIQFAGFRITMSWALEGAALAWLSTRFESTKTSIAATVVLTLAVLRLYVFDANFEESRFLTFAVGAASLFLAARFFTDRLQKLIAYIGAHIVALTALGLQLVSWINHHVAKDDQFQTATVSISILMAIYAVMLITIGVAAKSSINRVLGLILMSLVVLKLYLSDVWELGFVFRIVAFLGLGVLLLTVSYLYSHYRPAIEKLLKDDTSA